MSDALALGNFEAAERYAALEHRVAMDAGALGAEALMLVGRIQLGLGHPEAACDLLEQSIALSAEAGYPIAPEADLWLGRAYQCLGDKAHAINQFQIVLQRSRPDLPSPPYMPDAKPVFALALAALDEVLANRTEFAAVWRPLLDGPWRDAPFFTHPDLVPATALDHGQAPITSIDPADPRWRWEDPEGDCSWTTGEGYVEIFAANGRDLWWTNFSAPRLVRTFDGDFSLQVRCEPADDQTPAIGGLLLWLDERNYLRLDRGSGGRDELVFMGCIGGESAVIGRGRLPTAAVELRLDRMGADVAATCRGDGGGWLTLGRAVFPAGPVAAGLFAVGLVERTLYLGVGQAGARVRFGL